LSERPDAAGVLLLHGTGGNPGLVWAGLPIELHLGDLDSMFPPPEVDAWCTAMTNAGAAVRLYTYPGVGHFFTDPDVPEYDTSASVRDEL
jgi:dienelactone hydrolase